jgi:hypothetical protein
MAVAIGKKQVIVNVRVIHTMKIWKNYSKLDPED